MSSIQMHVAAFVILILWFIGLFSVTEYHYTHDNNKGGIALLLFFLGTCGVIYLWGGK